MEDGKKENERLQHEDPRYLQSKRRGDRRDAPNILLSLHGGSKTHELVIGAVSGVVLQVGVLVYAAFATHNQNLKGILKSTSSQAANYGYPILVIGTSILVLGMMICSFVIESSTEEKIWTSDKKFRTLWLQKRLVVGDQTFDSYILSTGEDSSKIITSRRLHKMKRISELLTLVGTITGLAGFVLQFIGLRGLNWTISIAQLIATAIMTMLRAWVRAGLLKRPDERKIDEVDHEMDWLALKMHQDHGFGRMNLNDSQPSYWGIPWGKERYAHVGSFGTDLKSQPRSNSAPSPRTIPEADIKQELAWDPVSIRVRLGDLTGWDGPGIEQANLVATAIDKVMETFFQQEKPPFTWYLDTAIGSNRPYQEIALVKLTIEKTAKGEWEVDRSQISAILSLWRFDIERKRREPGENWRESFRQLLGPNKHNILRRDIAYWIGDNISVDEIVDERDLTIGYKGLEGNGNISIPPYKMAYKICNRENVLIIHRSFVEHCLDCTNRSSLSPPYLFSVYVGHLKRSST